MRGNHRHVREELDHFGHCLRRGVNQIRGEGVPARVERYRQSQGGDGIIDREHFGIVNEKALVIRM